MSNIEKIKAEIERLKAKYRKDMYKSNYEGLASGYKIEAYNELLAFIDSLPEEKPTLTVEDIKTILDISFWVLPPVMKPSEEEEYYTKILEEYNRLCDTSKVIRR